jgi:hypothetical protein
MKTLQRSLSVALLFVATLCFGQTNSPTLLEQTKAVAQTNLNQVMIQILSGVSSAGGEIYDASKSAIKSSVDFVTEQAPDVVRQFITWKLAESITWACIWTFITLCFFYFANKCRLMQKHGARDDAGSGWSTSFTGAFWKWAFTTIGLFVFILNVGSYARDIVKISVAPKVYIIEYVVDLARPNTSGCRHQ